VRRETAVLALGALAQDIRLELVSLLAASGAERGCRQASSRLDLAFHLLPCRFISSSSYVRGW
jgi:hypothetical protein